MALLVTTATLAVQLLVPANSLFAASTERVLYSFCTLAGCPDGSIPAGPLIFDAARNLYGETAEGGRYGDGTVFELMPAQGKWKQKVLHDFRGKDGALPLGGLVFDAAGNLYGVTAYSGAYGYGNVFELTPSNGKWTEKVLHSFKDGNDGGGPNGGLILDAAGNLFGVTDAGGTSGKGTVFELIHASGGWTEKVLYNFGQNANDPAYPWGTLVFDGAGNLYGTTPSGGTFGYGAAFELIRGSGEWTGKVLYNFGQNTNDAATPEGSLVFDEPGNLYGSAQGGGTEQLGTIFELSRLDGVWSEQVLYRFKGGNDSEPAPVIFGTSGNLYGGAGGGGSGYTGGEVFELIHSDGEWTERVLHTFVRPRDGKGPGPLVFDPARNLFGLTGGGGAAGEGTAFEVRP